MRAVAVLFVVFWGFFFFGLIDLLVYLQGAEFMPSFHLETGWGLFFLIIVAAPLLAVALRPGALLPAALQQVFAAGVAVASAPRSAVHQHTSSRPQVWLPPPSPSPQSGEYESHFRAFATGHGSPERWWWARPGRASPMH